MNQVIDAVVFRGLAGTRIAANDRWTMNGDRKLGFQRLDFQFRRILCFLVMIAKAGSVLELVFVNHSLALAGHIAGRDVMITAQTRNGLHKVVHVARPFNIDALRYFRPHGKIINRRQVKHGAGFISN